MGLFQIALFKHFRVRIPEQFFPEEPPDGIIEGTAATISTKASKWILRSSGCIEQSAPAKNKSESPGRKGMTTNPVSQKIMRNRITYIQAPYRATICAK